MLRAPPSSVYCIVNKPRGVALWVVDANKAKAAQKGAATKKSSSAKSTKGNKVAAGTSLNTNAPSTVEAITLALDLNLRASHLASKGDGEAVPVYGNDRFRKCYNYNESISLKSWHFNFIADNFIADLGLPSSTSLDERSVISKLEAVVIRNFEP